MDELLKTLAWVQTLDCSIWSEDEDEQMQWVAERSSVRFDTQRARVLAAVQMQDAGIPLCEGEHQILNLIRETGLMTVNRWSFVDGLSECAVADFELIARALRVGFSDFWLDKLRAEYEGGRFPHGTL